MGEDADWLNEQFENALADRIAEFQRRTGMLPSKDETELDIMEELEPEETEE